MTNKNIIFLVNRGFSYAEAAKKLNITRSAVAGVIWRYNNPGMWKKGVENNSKQHLASTTHGR